MHVNLRGALGIGIPVLLGSAVAVGAAALPARATTWQDTAVSASTLTASTFGGAGLGAANKTSVDIKLSGTGVTWALNGTVPKGVSLSGTTISASNAAATGTTEIVADATDSAGNAEALEIPVAIKAGSIQLGSGSVATVTVSALALTNVSNTVKFGATSNDGNTISFAESNLPAGLVSGDPVLTYVGGTAAPGTYKGVKVAATDADGAALTGTFTLVVKANAVSGYGDEVNRFGNGFDSYQQHQFPGAIIAGWAATRADPATHFILNTGTHQGAVQFEYAPKGRGTGLCVSDPGGGWRSDPLRDGLILTPCNTGPWQQFIPQSNNTLRNVATGLFVNPNGTGAQLRGGTSPTPWGGSSYAWTDFNNLPA
jgi:hypothetical protein